MEHSLSVALVIPTYNRAVLVAETIRSALAQTTPFSEIIVVDDGSTDDTLAALRTFGDAIRVVQVGKVGLQAARNAGADASGSQYITFCDSDDLLMPEFLRTVKGWLARHENWDSVYSNYCSFTENGVDRHILANAPPGFLAGATQIGSFIAHVPNLYARTAIFQPMLASGATVRKAFFKTIGGFDTAINGIASEDWEYTLRAVGNGMTAICTEPLVRIRRHAGNQSRNLLRQVLGEIEIIKFALEHHPIARQHHNELVQAMLRRRHHVFYESVQTGRFALAALVLPLLRGEPQSVAFRIKALAVRAYGLLYKPDARQLLGFAITPDRAIHRAGGLPDTPAPSGASNEQVGIFAMHQEE